MLPFGSGRKVNKLLLHSIFYVPPFSRLKSVLSLEVVVHKYSFRSQQNYLEGMLNDQHWPSPTLVLFCCLLSSCKCLGVVLPNFEAHCVHLRELVNTIPWYQLGKTGHSLTCITLYILSFHFIQNSNIACSILLQLQFIEFMPCFV